MAIQSSKSGEISRTLMVSKTTAKLLARHIISFAMAL